MFAWESEALGRFAELVSRSDALVPLDEVGLVIAAHGDHRIDIGAELAKIDELAAGVSEPTLTGVLRLLFRDLGFHGNKQDYYDIRNSFLHEVIARRTGIPITLSVVVIEVGRRLGVPLSGVGMPGHFLIRDKVDPNVFVDAFNQGATLDAARCMRLFHEINGASAAFRAEFLEPVPRAAIAARILSNLRTIYARQGDLYSLCWVARLRARLPLADASIWREYALVAAKTARIDEAVEAYETAARLDPSRSEADLRDAEAQRARLN